MVYHFNKVIFKVYTSIYTLKLTLLTNVMQFCIVRGSIATSLLHYNEVSAKFYLFNFSTFVLFWIVPLEVTGVRPGSYEN